MRKFKSFISVIMALTVALMTLSFTAVSTSAATSTVSFDGTTAGTYTFYQIFTGTTLSTSSTSISDVAWGTAFSTEEAQIAVVKAIAETFEDELEAKSIELKYETSNVSTAADVVSAINTALNTNKDSDDAIALANIFKECAAAAYLTNVDPSSTATVENGYYLVVSTAGTQSALLTVVGATTLTTKTTTEATVSKATSDEDITTYPNAEETFEITVYLPDNLYLYDAGYTVEVTDELTNLALKYDLNIDNDAVTYVLEDASGDKSSSTAITSTVNDLNYATGTSPYELSFTISLTADQCDSYNDGKIIITYTAITGSEYSYNTTKNEVSIKYSNDPTATTSGLPSEPGEDEGDPVTLYEYKLLVNKVDGSNNHALQGALFSLARTSTATSNTPGGPFNDSGTTISEAGTDTAFYFYTLDTGTYTLTETTTPTGGYTTANPSTIVIGSDGAVTIDGEDSTSGNFTVSSGLITMNVVNTIGTVMPTTGGMGTKIFYTLGGILVVGAAVLLITKRRMNADR